MTIRALLFDVDGTIADTEEAHRLAFNDAFGAEGLPYRWDAPTYLDLLKVTGGKERLASFFDGFALSDTERRRLDARIPAIHQAKNERYAELVEMGAAPLRAGVVRLFDEAAHAGIRLGIATTTSPANVSVLLETALGPRALSRFAVVASGDAVRAKKPAPDIYELALFELGLPADDVVAFEDSENGLVSAKTTGLFTVVTPTRWTSMQDFSAADLLVPSLGDETEPFAADLAERLGHPFVTLDILLRTHDKWRSGRTAS